MFFIIEFISTLFSTVPHHLPASWVCKFFLYSTLSKKLFGNFFISLYLTNSHIISLVGLFPLVHRVISISVHFEYFILINFWISSIVFISTLSIRFFNVLSNNSDFSFISEASWFFSNSMPSFTILSIFLYLALFFFGIIFSNSFKATSFIEHISLLFSIIFLCILLNK